MVLLLFMFLIANIGLCLIKGDGDEKDISRAAFNSFYGFRMGGWIAGWLQGDKGGRALLKKNPHGWQTQLCAGEVNATLLQQAGVPAGTAKQLLDQQITAEKGLSRADVSLLSSFVGVVRMDAVHGHQPHGQQADASAVAHHAH
ncbi:copper uptake system-associated protein [Iodobacter sp. LRB]|uniref:copper uptake system-associated protein n=1 Tax=unclassified Iodobacter TaxID=235634 RepID=UPI000C0FDE49|nr:copper uptake system-associated protein [Iodobacter sp. BJB302]PHV00946.1 hypothetical protein CSQ88_14770 [Iodobacter sp. BJB302]